MQSTKIFLFLLLFIFISCEKELLPKDRNYPFPSSVDLRTNDGVNVEFSGQLLSLGTEEIIKYGFIWEVIDYRFEQTGIDTFLIQEPPSLDEFYFKSASHFGTGFRYKVKIFVKTTSNTVYGPTLVFTSKGTQNNPWEVNFFDTSIPTANPLEISYQLYSSPKTAYAFFYHNGFFELSNGNLEQKENYLVPHLSPLSNNNVISFPYEDQTYFWNVQKAQHHIYNNNNNSWDATSIGNMPNDLIHPNYSKGFTFNDKMYVLDRNTFIKSTESIESNPLSQWEELDTLPTFYHVESLNVSQTNALAIAITNDKTMWTYNLSQEGSWESKTSLPFDYGESIVSFNFGNHMIVGPAISTNSNKQRWWKFDLSSEVWSDMIPFPFIIDEELKITSSESTSHGYFGVDLTYADSSKLKTVIWSLNSSKL